MMEAQGLEFDFEKIVDDVLGAEGPVFDKNGKFYMVAPEIEVDGQPAGQVIAVDIDNKTNKLVCVPSIDGYGGIPAGCQCDRQGNIWVADMRLGILKINPLDGSFIQVAKVDSAGDVLQGCNDCCLDFSGNLWVTAPAGPIAPSPYTRSDKEAFGSVYFLRVDQDEAPIKVDTGILFPNGVAVQHTPDGKPQLLLVAETFTKTIWAYDIIEPGKLGKRKLWGKLPGDHAGGPDGMDFDADGRLLVAHWGSSRIEVFGAEGGDPTSYIQCPFSTPSNLHFKPGTKEVYVTEHQFHALWKFTWQSKGEKQFCDL